MASKVSKPAAPAGIQKHRACDECRSRKLACSKEPGGCSRCRKEGLRCHYSPQKPMGRPRKNRSEQPEQQQQQQQQQKRKQQKIQQSGQDQYHGLQTQDPPYSPLETSNTPPFDDVSRGSETSAPPPDSYTMSAPMIPLDPNLDGFLDNSGAASGAGAGAGSMGFLGMLPTYSDTTAQADPSGFMAATNMDPGAGQLPLDLSGVDIFTGMSFVEPEHRSDPLPRDVTESLHRYMNTQYPNPLEHSTSPPSDFSQSTATPEPLPSSHGRSIKPNPNISCGCLSSLYLTLDSLSNLPTDVYAAMRVARNASKVAYDVINCPHCSDLIVSEPLAPVPIQAFQNLMCLAALVPAACNAYASILEMVDREAALAQEEDRTMWFSFRDIGGLWGQFEQENSHCRLMQNYNNRHMPPDFWRSTIRAVLRLDVYGFADDKQIQGLTQPLSTYRQQGLRDVVSVLDERSRKRHEAIDAIVASGRMPKDSPYLLHPSSMKSVPPQERTCFRMFETARVALNNLVIA